MGIGILRWKRGWGEEGQTGQLEVTLSPPPLSHPFKGPPSPLFPPLALSTLIVFLIANSVGWITGPHAKFADNDRRAKVFFLYIWVINC